MDALSMYHLQRAEAQLRDVENERLRVVRERLGEPVGRSRPSAAVRPARRLRRNHRAVPAECV